MSPTAYDRRLCVVELFVCPSVRPAFCPGQLIGGVVDSEPEVPGSNPAATDILSLAHIQEYMG